MIKKSFSKTGKSCRVTFKVTPEGLEQADVEEANEVSLVGDFNEWDPKAHPLKKRKNGEFSTTVSLEAGKPYDFRYLIDNKFWLNDEEADTVEMNRFGSKNAVIEL